MAEQAAPVADTVLDIIARSCKIERDRLTPDATLETLGIASIDVIEVLMIIEEDLGVYLSLDETLAKATNLQELVGALVSQIEQRKKS